MSISTQQEEKIRLCTNCGEEISPTNKSIPTQRGDIICELCEDSYWDEVESEEQFTMDRI